MILPLTHEHGTVRRLPLVTFVVMAVCLVVQIRVAGESREMRASEERFGTALQYYLERPYLDADPRLAPPELTDLLAEMGVEELGEGRPSALQQQTLDDYTESWLEGLGRHPLWSGGLLPAEIEAPDLITHAFHHGGWIHLLGNLLFLYLLGPFVEDRWGRWTYGAFYLAGAAAAGLGFALHYPNLFRPLVGASGAVAAIMAAFLILHGKAKIKFLYFIGFAAGTFQAPAWLMLPLWFVGELVSAVSADAALPGGIGGGVAYWAHVWGFVFGLVVAVGLRVTGIERRLLPPAEDDDARTPAHVADPVLAQVARLQLRGRADEAWRALDRAVRDPRVSIPVLEARWDLALERGRPEEGADVLRRLIQEELRRDDVDRALSHWNELRDTLPAEPHAPRVGVPLAEGLAKEGRRLDAEDVLRDAAPALGPRTPLGVLVRATRLADELEDPELRVHTLDAALGHPNLPAELREELELRRPLQ